MVSSTAMPIPETQILLDPRERTVHPGAPRAVVGYDCGAGLVVDVHVLAVAADRAVRRLDEEVARDIIEHVVLGLHLLDDARRHAVDLLGLVEYRELHAQQGAVVVAFEDDLPPDREREVGVVDLQRERAVLGGAHRDVELGVGVRPTIRGAGAPVVTGGEDQQRKHDE
jgi:hypothetical protein